MLFQASSLTGMQCSKKLKAIKGQIKCVISQHNLFLTLYFCLGGKSEWHQSQDTRFIRL